MLTKKDMQQLFKIMPDLTTITLLMTKRVAEFERIAPNKWYSELMKGYVNDAFVVDYINTIVKRHKDDDIIAVLASNGVDVPYNIMIQDRVVVDQIEDERRARKAMKGRRTRPAYKRCKLPDFSKNFEGML